MLGTTLSDTSKSEPKSDWLLQTDRHYKIWFSADPKEFLSVENKMRLIRFRVENPHAEIYFVYSSKILSEQTCVELKEFFQPISITPIDFDQDIPVLLNHDYDKILYQIAQVEIERALSGEGGNLAAASDCVRLLPGLIEKCGIYSDLDVELCFNTLAQFIALQSPVVFPCVIELDGKNIQNMSFNNELLSFAQNPLTKKLAPEAIASIRAAQLEIIQRYAKPAAALLAPVIRGLHTAVALDPELNALVTWYISNVNNGSERSVFDLRQFIKKLSIKYLCMAIYPHFFQNEQPSVDLSFLSHEQICAYLGACLRKEFQL
ncbi:MAG: glycosyltransferase family 88 protein, partial [Candidatus Berkiella sp.]